MGATSQGENVSARAIPVSEPTTSLTTNNTYNQTIYISKNYLPLGITSAVKDAYFNHNGIIWHYHNGFAEGDNDGIYIESCVNAYIGGTIQGQESGADYLAMSQYGSPITANINTSLTDGVYNEGYGLTSVASVNGMKNKINNQIMYRIDNQALKYNGDNHSYSNSQYPYVSLFGGKVDSSGASTNLYSSTVSPANVQVKLTLVPASEPSAQTNK